jgi:hypothetical protein
MISTLCQARNSHIIPRLLDEHVTAPTVTGDVVDLSIAENMFMRQRLAEATRSHLVAGILEEARVQAPRAFTRLTGHRTCHTLKLSEAAHGFVDASQKSSVHIYARKRQSPGPNWFLGQVQALS